MRVLVPRSGGTDGLGIDFLAAGTIQIKRDDESDDFRAAAVTPTVKQSRGRP
jgi:hypothetical protein